MINENRPRILQVVTGSAWKQEAFQQANAETAIVVFAANPQYDEKRLSSTLPDTIERPWRVAEAKAKADMIAIGILGAIHQLADSGCVEEIFDEKNRLYRLYTDTVQVVYEADGSHKILEKPSPNLIQWMQGPDAMLQSGKIIEIVTAISAVDVFGSRKPETVMVRVQARVRSYTREDILNHSRQDNHVKGILQTAGGLSLANGGRSFYDTDYPLKVFLQTELDGEPELIHEVINWGGLSNEELKPAITGAYEPAIRKVLEKTAQACTED